MLLTQTPGAYLQFGSLPNKLLAVWINNVKIEKTNDERLLRGHQAEIGFTEPRIREV